jgi:hypothetical protein
MFDFWQGQLVQAATEQGAPIGGRRSRHVDRASMRRRVTWQSAVRGTVDKIATLDIAD